MRGPFRSVHLAEASGLEGYAQGQLNLSPTLLDTGNLAELRIPDCGNGVAEAGSVEDVERVGTKLDESTLAEPESLEYAEVLRGLSIAPEVAEIARGGAQACDHATRRNWGFREGVWIEVLDAG